MSCVFDAVVWGCSWSHFSAPGRKQEQGSHELLILTWTTADLFLNLCVCIVLSVVPSLCSHFSTLSSLLLLNGRLSSYQSFLDILNEMNDYAGQRELIAENMMMSICIDLTKYLQELKQERKTVSLIWSGPGVLCIRMIKVRLCSRGYIRYTEFAMI